MPVTPEVASSSLVGPAIYQGPTEPALPGRRALRLYVFPHPTYLRFVQPVCKVFGIVRTSPSTCTPQEIGAAQFLAELADVDPS